MHYTEIENLFTYIPRDGGGFNCRFNGTDVHKTIDENSAKLWVQTSIDAVNMVLNEPGLIRDDANAGVLKTYIENHPDFSLNPHISVFKLALMLIRERDAIDNILNIRR
jgi:hypothetical protein